MRAPVFTVVVFLLLAFSAAAHAAPVRPGTTYFGLTGQGREVQFEVDPDRFVVAELSVELRCEGRERVVDLFAVGFDIGPRGRFHVKSFDRFRYQGAIRQETHLWMSGRFLPGGRLRGVARVAARLPFELLNCRRRSVRFSAWAPSRASTLTGAVTQLPGRAGCLLGFPAGSCGAARGLQQPTALAVSPDGRNVYVLDEDPEGVVAFRRSLRTGALRALPGRDGCVRWRRSRRCRKATGLRYARDLTLSPDGRHVYVVSLGTVAVLSRDRRTGALKQPLGDVGCVGKARGCRRPGRDVSFDKLEISPDGRHAYATGSLNDASDDVYEDTAILAFRRDARKGTLTPLPEAAGCISRFGLRGCASSPRLVYARALVVPRGGRHLYVAVGDAAVGLVGYRRDRRSGALRQIPGRSGCLARRSRLGCGHIRGFFDGHSGPLAASPDGRTVYFAMFDRLAVIRRDPVTGGLGQLPGVSGCVGNGAVRGCRVARGIPNIEELAASPDGRNLYTASRSAGMAVFARARDGGLAQLRGRRGCLITTKPDFLDDFRRTDNCARPRAVETGTGVALDPNGNNVYLSASSYPGGVAVFHRRR